MKKFIKTSFQNPYLASITEQIVIPQQQFWKNYSVKPKNTLLIHTGYRNMPAQKKISIPGSLYIDSCQFQTPPIWDKNSDSELQEFYERHNFGSYDRIMLYGTRGNMAACRFALILIYMGFTKIKVLDGGIASNQFDMKKINVTNHTQSKQFIPMKTHKQVMMTAKQAWSQQFQGNCQLVDIRSTAEHFGLISGYPDFHKKGRPLGCVYGQNIDKYVSQSMTKGNFDRIIQLWDTHNVDWRHKKLILFCGTGWRAAEAFIYGLDYGLTNLAVFSGIRDWIESGLATETTVQ